MSDYVCTPQSWWYRTCNLTDTPKSSAWAVGCHCFQKFSLFLYCFWSGCFEKWFLSIIHSPFGFLFYSPKVNRLKKKNQQKTEEKIVCKDDLLCLYKMRISYTYCKPFYFIADFGWFFLWTGGDGQGAAATAPVLAGTSTAGVSGCRRQEQAHFFLKDVCFNLVGSFLWLVWWQGRVKMHFLTLKCREVFCS